MTKNEKTSLALEALSALYDFKLLDLTSEACLEGMIAEIDELLDLNTSKTLAARHDYFQVLGTSEKDFKERFYDFRGKRLLAGIRHVNSRSDKPFVHFFLGFQPTIEDLTDLKEIARREFQIFKPIALSIWLKPSSLLAIELEKNHLTARRYLVGRLSELAVRPLPSRFSQLHLEPVKTLDFDWYKTAYDEFHAEKPDLKNWVPRTATEELQKNAAEGLLFYVNVDGCRAGLIAATGSPFLGQPGIYMTELLLTGLFRRKGLAVALQRKFIEAVKDRADFIWGTIDARNQSSTKTALRIGRIPVRAEFFIQL